MVWFMSDVFGLLLYILVVVADFDRPTSVNSLSWLVSAYAYKDEQFTLYNILTSHAY